MATFALCGFANFASIAIQIGGIGGIAPSRKADLAKLGLKAVMAGTLANLMTATWAGILFFWITDILTAWSMRSAKVVCPYVHTNKDR